MKPDQEIIDQYLRHISSLDYPCVGAKASVQRGKTNVLLSENICCPNDDLAILNFLYDFIDNLRKDSSLFQSVSIIFKSPTYLAEEEFERFLWTRLQSLSDLDAKTFGLAKGVEESPDNPEFCYSLKEEAFFVLALHKNSSRESRKFEYPVLVFNPHAQFEMLRESGAYAKLQNIIRKKDIDFSGSINPMLSNFGERSAVFQISGRNYESDWQCPFKPNYTKT